MTFSQIMNSKLLYILVIAAIAYVLVFSVLTLIRSWKHGQEIGLSKEKTERCYHFFGDLFHPAVHFHHHWSVFSDGRSGCALVLVPPVGGRLRNVRVDGSRYGGDRQRLRIHWCPKRFR